jgi:hypothetical protein
MSAAAFHRYTVPYAVGVVAMVVLVCVTDRRRRPTVRDLDPQAVAEVKRTLDDALWIAATARQDADLLLGLAHVSEAIATLDVLRRQVPDATIVDLVKMDAAALGDRMRRDRARIIGRIVAADPTLRPRTSG